MRYDAIFFDLDGTVVDSLQDIADAVNHTMRHFGLPEHRAESLRPLLGWGAGHLLEMLQPRPDPAQLQQLLDHYRPYYARHTADKTQPFPGILPMLARLRADGLVLTILSNKPDSAVQPLAEKYFNPYMALCLGEREGVRRKPAPDMVLDCAARLEIAPARCLYVGDSEVDIQTAQNAGTDCLCVSWGFRSRAQLEAAGARWIVDTPDALVEFVEKS